MQKLLHNIRSRSLRERQRIVYGSAFVVTLVICGIWLSLLQYDKHTASTSQSTSSQFAPLQSLSSGIKNMWSNAKYSVSKKTDTPANATVPTTDSSEQSEDTEISQDSEGQIILEPQPAQTDTSTPIKD